MHQLHVIAENVFAAKPFATHGAFERPLARVDAHVGDQRLLLREIILAYLALVGLLARMSAHMAHKIALLAELLLALFAAELLLCRVGLHVAGQVGLALYFLSAHFTFVGLFVAVHIFVVNEGAFVRKCLATYATPVLYFVRRFVQFRIAVVFGVRAEAIRGFLLLPRVLAGIQVMH